MGKNEEAGWCGRSVARFGDCRCVKMWGKRLARGAFFSPVMQLRCRRLRKSPIGFSANCYISQTVKFQQKFFGPELFGRFGFFARQSFAAHHQRTLSSPSPTTPREISIWLASSNKAQGGHIVSITSTMSQFVGNVSVTHLQSCLPSSSAARTYHFLSCSYPPSPS